MKASLVPLDHGAGDVGVQKVMNPGVRRGGRGRASREVPRHPGGLEEFPHLVPQGIAFDKKPGREVKEEAGVIEPLDSSNGRRDGPVHNEVVVHVRVASGLAGGVNDSSDDAEPVGRRKKMGLDVPITANDPRATRVMPMPFLVRMALPPDPWCWAVRCAMDRVGFQPRLRA